ncbi:MAG: hypothetical protein HKN73_14320 [Gemmatimonadetes bacterium]|nr:hypothetical protein [Gemmatimonadota bacterium]
MDDAPTVEFENESEDWMEAASTTPATPPPEVEDLDEERPPPEWVLPGEDESGPDAGAGYDGIASGPIPEGLTPVGAAPGDERSSVEVLARLHEAQEASEALEVDDSGVASDDLEMGAESAEGGNPPATSEPLEGLEAEAVREEDDGELEKRPDPVIAAGTLGSDAPRASGPSRPGSMRRRGVGGFNLVVSPAKPQRRFRSRGIVAPVALLAAIGAVVAVLIRFL